MTTEPWHRKGKDAHYVVDHIDYMTAAWYKEWEHRGPLDLPGILLFFFICDYRDMDVQAYIHE